MRAIPCFDVQDHEDRCTFSLSDRQGMLLYSVNSRNEQWRNIRMNQLYECVMGNRIYRTLEEINGNAPGTLICQEEGGYRLRFYSTQGNELAHTDVYDDKDHCIDVYWRIYAIFRQQRVKNRFAR